MASITVRDIDTQSYRSLQARARRNKRSMAAEVRARIAGDSDAPDMDAIVRDLMAFQNGLRARHGEFSDSAALVRTMRDDG